MSWHRYALTDLPPHPWKNGGGLTRELAGWPAGSSLGDFGWRVSVAEVASSGPFSTFAGVDRVILLLDGDGMRLTSCDTSIDHRLDRPLAPFRFPGEADIRSELLGGVSHDFNVMTRRRLHGAEVQIIRNACRLPRGSHGLLHAARGKWRADNGNLLAETLDAGSGLAWYDMDNTWQLAPLTPDATLIVVSIPSAASHD